MNPGSSDLTDLQRRWLAMAVSDQAPTPREPSSGITPKHQNLTPQAQQHTFETSTNMNNRNWASTLSANVKTPLSAELMPPPSNRNSITRTPSPQTPLPYAAHEPSTATPTTASASDTAIRHSASFSNLSMVSSLSGDDAQSLSFLGLESLDELQASDRLGSKVGGHLRGMFSKSILRPRTKRSNAGRDSTQPSFRTVDGIDTSMNPAIDTNESLSVSDDDASVLSLSDTSSEGTVQTGSAGKDKKGSAPINMAIGAALALGKKRNPFHQRNPSGSSVEKNMPGQDMYSRQATFHSAPAGSSSSYTRQLPPSSPQPSRPSSISQSSRSRTTPINWGSHVPADNSLPQSADNHFLLSPSVQSRQGSIGPPRPSPMNNRGQNRQSSSASLSSHASYASVQSSILSVQSGKSSTMHRHVPSGSLVQGGRLDTDIMVTAGPLNLGSRPRRVLTPRSPAGQPLTPSHSVTGLNDTDSVVSASTAGTMSSVSSLREAEVRKVSHVVKQEIKYKLGKMVPTIHKRTGSLSGAAGDPSVQLKRSKGCLT